MSFTVENNLCTIGFPNMDRSPFPGLTGTCDQGKCQYGFATQDQVPRTAVTCHRYGMMNLCLKSDLLV
jgi:hypothetical protein